jgi:hypothetical protein
MTLVDSLPPRPLGPEELMQLNAADALELAVPIEEEGRASGVLVATDAWVKGLAFDADAESWRRSASRRTSNVSTGYRRVRQRSSDSVG